ncbi:MAG: alginate export family protein, partial [Desulfobacterota bacterium]|nr:alginate export family protein [Thermodesulfobacteriota bacterium]
MEKLVRIFAIRFFLTLVLAITLYPYRGFAAEKMSISLLDDKLHIGGQFFLRQEARNNYYTQDGKVVSDDTVSSRFRISLAVQPTKGINFYLTLIDARDWDDPHPYLFTYTYDHPFDIQQCYLELNKLAGLPITIWGGRREVVYLNERLIGTAIGWTNKNITYDGGGLKVSLRKTEVDFFTLNKVDPKLPDEDDCFNDDWFDDIPANLYGIWLTNQNFPVKVEIFGLFDDRKDRNDFYTSGGRVSGKKGSFDFDYALVYQWGHNRVGSKRLSRRAWATYIETGWTVKKELRAALQYNFATGDDDPNDGKYKTFDQMYGCVHGLYGLMDFFSWQNIHDFYPYLQVTPLPNLRITFGLHSFWLAQPEDAWYSAYKKVQRR